MIHINRAPTAPQLRQFAAIWLPLFGLTVGGILWWRFGLPTAAAWTWGATAAVSLAAFVNRHVARAVFLGLSYVTFPIGFVVAWLGLAIVFFGLVLPMGLVMRLSGRDRLRLRPPPPGATMWHPHVDRLADGHYFRQF